MAKLNSAEEKILEEISKWKTKGPGMLTRATDFLSKPLQWAYEELVPGEAKDKIGDVSESIIDKLKDVSQWTVKEEDVLKNVREFEIDSKTIIELRKATIFDLDHVSEDYLKQNRNVAAAGGFGTGLVGWAGLIADLPTLFTVSFRLIYQVSLTYGYPVNHEDDPEKEAFEVGYMLRVFRVATASNKEEKIAGLLDLKDFELAHREVSSKIGQDFTRKQIGKTAAIQVSRTLINRIVQQTMARKAITMIPAIGAILNAGFNYSYVKDVGETAFMLYRERFLLDKKGRSRSVNVVIE